MKYLIFALVGGLLACTTVQDQRFVFDLTGEKYPVMLSTTDKPVSTSLTLLSGFSDASISSGGANGVSTTIHTSQGLGAPIDVQLATMFPVQLPAFLVVQELILANSYTDWLIATKSQRMLSVRMLLGLPLKGGQQ